MVQDIFEKNTIVEAKMTDKFIIALIKTIIMTILHVKELLALQKSAKHQL